MIKHTMVLIDGSYYLFRAFHAVRNLRNAKGEPTGAIYGFINMIKKHLGEGGPDYFGVVFDAKGGTFRNKLYPKYKANRPPMPDELVCQIQPLHDIIHAMGIPLLKVADVEADDVIATLSLKASKQGIKTIISTGDKDLAQIVNDNTHLINTMNDVYLDEEGVKNKFGVHPCAIIDYLILIGDSVDNIKGVSKVGPKTAVKWLKEYGSLEEIIKNAHQIAGKIGENLREFIPEISLSRELITLKRDVCLDVEPENLIIKKPDNAKLKIMFSHLGFNSWLSKLKPQQAIESFINTNTNNPTYETILTEEQLDSLIEKLYASKLVSIDTETSSLNYMQAQIVGISFAITKNSASYIPLAHDYTNIPKQLSLEKTLKKLKPFLENENKYKVGQNIKYDLAVFANHGIVLKGILHDTMLESYVLNSSSRHDMDSLAFNYLNVKTIHYEDVTGKGIKQIPFSQVPIEKATEYAAEDADITLNLHETLFSKLQQQDKLKNVYENIEIPLLPVLAKMEQHGVMVDTLMLKMQGDELKKQMQAIETLAQKLAGEIFNIGSPKQIQSILYEKMCLPILAKTPKGQPSTAESVLKELAENHELPKLILEHRSLNKLFSTYTEKLPQMVSPKTNRVHTTYRQSVAATGRLSSSEPNLQNIPIRTKEGRKIRQAFIAPKSYLLLAADYSQIELRIMAHLSKDKDLLHAFETGLDIHKTTAAEVFSVPIESVTIEQRRAAKAINFGLIYGMSAFGLAKQLMIKNEDAKKYIELYFQRYPKVKTFMQQTQTIAKEIGYVETIYGRRLYLPEINSRNAGRRQYAERSAINAPMQGTAADIIKLAMIEIDKWMVCYGIDAKMIMQVHDELVFEVATDFLEEFIPKIKEIMCKNNPLSVPLEVNVGYGNNWDKAH